VQAVIFTGPQGAGKSSWFARHLAATHVRLGLDLVGTRHRETVLLHACLAVGQRFAIDNTNATRSARARYIASARAAGFEVEVVWFDVPAALALERNAARTGKARVPDIAIHGWYAKFEPPVPDEGYDRLIVVRPEQT
jgi:predicted kinase